ncbi:MAG TPA: helix-turn-helix transcriptional regulator [Vicinamibacterales bacterium]|nr:helix-turn-helix transcriptional regulator [Vicinamibacterales bacterium]
MGEKFGARLRQRREALGIDLDTIARRTKIKLSLLEALEQDDVSAWPGGLFRRAFIRAFAQAVALDPDGAVREFLVDFPDPPEADDPWADPNGRDSAARSAPPTRFHAMVGSAMSSLSRLRHGDRPPPVGEPPVKAPAPPIQIDFDLPAADDPPATPADEAPVRPMALTLAPVGEPSLSYADLLAVAQLCTKLGRVDRADDLAVLLEECASLLEAKGLIVWVWDEPAAALRPALVHGYSDSVLARLPVVTRSSDNVTAEAFRTARICTIDGNETSRGALALPLLSPAGCRGVFAIEFERGVEQAPTKRAVATIVAAMLSQLITGETVADATSPAASRESA